MAQYGFYFDQKACAGCHTCQIACKDKNRLDIGELLRTVRSYETGEFPNVGIYHMAETCAHCDNPACVAACPTGRTVKDPETGVVYHDDNAMCAGEMCLRCVQACPYQHPIYKADEKKVVKCDMCRDIVAAGGEPACVASCMMRALKFGPVDELKAKYGADLVVTLPCFAEKGTGPNLLINPRDCALNAAFEEKNT